MRQKGQSTIIDKSQEEYLVVLVFLWSENLRPTPCLPNMRNLRFHLWANLLRVILKEVVSGLGVLGSEHPFER